jgi:20S proteasome subunit alpha 6
LRKSPNELATHQKKIEKIDEHMGVAISGLTADGRSIVKYLRNEALNNKYVYGQNIQAGRVVLDLADMHQQCTQSYVRRPYGVGLLVGAYDQTGPHLYVTEPSGNYFEYLAMAIGSRSQTSRTYLEKEYKTFPDASLEQLVKHAIKALAVSLAGDSELDVNCTSVAVVGEGLNFRFLEDNEVQRVLDEITVSENVVESAEMTVENPDF